MLERNARVSAPVTCRPARFASAVVRASDKLFGDSGARCAERDDSPRHWEDACSDQILIEQAAGSPEALIESTIAKYPSLNFTPKPMRETDMWGAKPFYQLACRLAFQSRDDQGPNALPSFRESIVPAENTGIFNWGGIAMDPVRQVMAGAHLRLAFVSRFVKRADDSRLYIHPKGNAAFGEDLGGVYAEPVGPFVSILGLPCQAPPGGLLAGASPRTGKTVWQRRNGATRDSFPDPAAAAEAKRAGAWRAYDIETGRQLWLARLPAYGQATPMTYRAADGRQMIVIAAGGNSSFGTTIGDSVVAMPRRRSQVRANERLGRTGSPSSSSSILRGDSTDVRHIELLLARNFMEVSGGREPARRAVYFEEPRPRTC